MIRPCLFKYLPLLIIAIVLLATAITYGQTDSTLFYQINQLRGPKHYLTYNTAKQKQVDRYAASNRFKQFIHSNFICGEVLAGSLTGDDFIDAWLRSEAHMKIIKNKKFKSMTYAVVKIRERYYQAVVQFYE